jgi:hypothetical protein
MIFAGAPHRAPVHHDDLARVLGDHLGLAQTPLVVGIDLSFALVESGIRGMSVVLLTHTTKYTKAHLVPGCTDWSFRSHAEGSTSGQGEGWAWRWLIGDVSMTVENYRNSELTVWPDDCTAPKTAPSAAIQAVRYSACGREIFDCRTSRGPGRLASGSNIRGGVGGRHDRDRGPFAGYKAKDHGRIELPGIAAARDRGAYRTRCRALQRGLHPGPTTYRRQPGLGWFGENPQRAATDSAASSRDRPGRAVRAEVLAAAVGGGLN